MNLADERQRAGVNRIERGRLLRVRERRIEIGRAPFDRRKLAVEKRALRRRGDRALIGLPGFVELTAVGELARRRDLLLDVAKPEHLGAALQVRQRRIRRDRRFERAERGVGAAEREQRVPLPRERRGVRRVLRERAIEVRNRRLRILARQRDVSEAGFGRIERGGDSRDRVERPVRVADVSRLQELPRRTVLVDERGRGRPRRRRGEHEVGKLRRRDRWRGRGWSVRAGSDQTEEHENR